MKSGKEALFFIKKGDIYTIFPNIIFKTTAYCLHQFRSNQY